MNSLGYQFIVFVTEDPVVPFDPNKVTPGPDGFFWTFLIAAATIFLIADMSRRMRRNNLRARAREELLAEAERIMSGNTDDNNQTNPDTSQDA